MARGGVTARVLSLTLTLALTLTLTLALSLSLTLTRGHGVVGAMLVTVRPRLVSGDLLRVWD